MLRSASRHMMAFPRVVRANHEAWGVLDST